MGYGDLGCEHFTFMEAVSKNVTEQHLMFKLAQVDMNLYLEPIIARNNLAKNLIWVILVLTLANKIHNISQYEYMNLGCRIIS